MKAVCSLIVCCAVLSSFAQGTVGFSNDGTSLVTYTIGGDDPVEVGGGYVELLWAAGGTPANPWVPGTEPPALSEWLTSNPGWQEARPSITPIGPLPGRFSGGTVVLPTPSPGAQVELMVVGWLGNYASFDDALASGSAAAYSPPFSLNTGNPTTMPPESPAVIPGPNGFRGLGFYIPEPSAAVLVTLGTAVVLLLRRFSHRDKT